MLNFVRCILTPCLLNSIYNPYLNDRQMYFMMSSNLTPFHRDHVNFVKLQTHTQHTYAVIAACCHVMPNDLLSTGWPVCFG